MSTRIRSCYITAPAGANLNILTEALRQRDIRIVVPQDFSLGVDPATEITGLLQEVDLVIGVLTRERRSEWVLFELGQAWMIGKRVLLFAPPDSVHLPSTLRRFLTVRANLSNREAIEFALDQLLALPERTPSPQPPATRSPALGQAADTFLQHSFRLTNAVSGYELENLVAAALRDGGVEVLSRAPGKDEGVDLAVWSDALQPYVGNPLLIQIKTRLPNTRVASNAAQRLSQQVTASGSFWGLLLYGQADQSVVPASLPPNVLVLSLQSLFERMRNEPFDDIVRELRNRRVHGGPK